MGGVGAKGEIWSNTGFLEFVFQIPGLRFLRSGATGCKIFSAFMKNKKQLKVLIFMALRRCMAVLKGGETCRERPWQNAEDDSGEVQCSVPRGVFLSLCCCST